MRNQYDSEGRRIGWLLTEIELEVSDRLSEESRLHLLDEVAGHLDAAIQARLELGMSPIDAEREAVQAFGHPRAYVDDLLRIHESSQVPKRRRSILIGDRKTLLAFWIITVYSIVWILLGDRSRFVPWDVAAIAAVSPFFAFFSFRARRVQTVPILVSSVAACFVFSACCSLSWHNLWAHGGTSVIPRWESAERIQADRLTIAKLDQLIQPLQHRVALHAKYFGSISTKRPSVAELRELMEVPVGRGIPYESGQIGSLLYWTPAPDSKLTFEPSATLATAERAWRNRGIPLYEHLVDRRDRDVAELTAILSARAASAISDFPTNLTQTARALPVWFALWATVNFIFGGLGWLLNWTRVKQRRRTA